MFHRRSDKADVLGKVPLFSGLGRRHLNELARHVDEVRLVAGRVLTSHVERAQRTHTEEFWERYDGDLELPAVRPALRHWEHLYNTFRPHQSLAQLTPAEYLAKCHPEAAPTAVLSHM